VKLENGVAPIQLVRLVADGEIENLEAASDGVGQEFAQMQRARSIMGDGAVHIACEHVIVAIAEHDAEIGRRAHIADLDAADVHKIAGGWIGGKLEEKLAMSGRSKDIADAFAGHREALLLHQDFKRAAGVGAIGRGHEADVAELRHVPQFRAVAPARRRRAPGAIECFPVRAQMGQVGVAAIGRDVKMHEWVRLGAHPFRHFLQFDAVVAQQWLALHVHVKLMPGGEEVVARRALREVRREQRGVVVAQVLTEPAQALSRIPTHQAKRRNERDVALGKAADDDHRTGAEAFADMPLPGREPVECLEGGAVGGALELPPFRLDCRELAENLDGELRPQVACALAGRRRRGGANLDRRSRPLKCRQCDGACHSIH
jgi:hypothetical protein